MEQHTKTDEIDGASWRSFYIKPFPSSWAIIYLILNIVTAYLYLILKNRELPCCTKVNVSGIKINQSLICCNLGGRLLGNPGYRKQKPERFAFFPFFSSSSFPTHIPTEKEKKKKEMLLHFTNI